MPKLNKFTLFVMNRPRAFLSLLLFLFFIAVILAGNAAMAEAPLADQQLTGNEAKRFLAREGILNEITNDLAITSSEGKNFEEPSPLAASDSASGDWFGWDIAIERNLLLVGAYHADVDGNGSQGAAYIFRYDGLQWNQEQKLIASDGDDGTSFGYSVALTGGSAIIGAIYAIVEGGAQTGAVYVFKYDGLQWNEEQKLIASDGEDGDMFGSSIDVAEDAIIVGASNADVNGNSNQGAAYIFRYDGNQWLQEQKLIASDGAEDDKFGISVAVSSENTAIIGGYSADVAGDNNRGAAYLFRKSGNTWYQEQKLVASDGQGGDFFGNSVELEGNTAIIGAFGDDFFSGIDRGSVYIFEYTGMIWQQQQKLLDYDGSDGDVFGSSLALHEDSLIVGAYFAEVNGSAGQGAAYVYHHNGLNWVQKQKFVAYDGNINDMFGISVALDEDTVVIGAWRAESNGIHDTGKVYVSNRGSVQWPISGSHTANDGSLEDQYGISLVFDGETAVAGATGADIGGNINQGAAYVFIRNGPIWVQQQKLVAADGAAGDTFGASVAIDGDTILIGASMADVNGNGEQGAAYLFHKIGNNWAQQQKLVASDGDSDHGFGHAVALSGDTAVVGALWAEVDGREKQGAVYIFKQNGTVWNKTQKLVAADGAEGDYFGSVLVLDQEKLIIGAERAFIDGHEAQGAVYVFQNDEANWTQVQKLTANDGLAGDLFGQAVGLDDSKILIGAAGADVNSLMDQGAAYVFRHDEAAWNQVQKLVASDGRAGDGFGSSVALWGKMAIVGAPHASVGGAYGQGAAYAFREINNIWRQEQKLLGVSGETEDNFGRSVSLNDNIALIGAPLTNENYDDQGRMYFYERQSPDIYLPIILQ